MFNSLEELCISRIETGEISQAGIETWVTLCESDILTQSYRCLSISDGILRTCIIFPLLNVLNGYRVLNSLKQLRITRAATGNSSREYLTWWRGGGANTYIYVYIFFFKKKQKTGHIRIMNLFPSCYVFLTKIIKNTKKINRTSSDLMDKIIQNRHRKEGLERG